MHVELARLPAEVAELIAGLGPGGSLVITHHGEPVATLAAAGRRPNPPAGDDDGVTVVATAMKLSDSARNKLSEELGTEYIVLDMHSAPSTADVLLVHPISPQLLANLRSMFPSARVVVAELDDPELGISYHGPVRRMLDSGAELYLSTTTVPNLARQLGQAVSAKAELAAGRRPRLELEFESESESRLEPESE